MTTVRPVTPRQRMRGFNPLQRGKIHLRCPGCGRKMSNMWRDESDPPDAALAEVLCVRCGSGTKDSSIDYYDKDGQPCAGRLATREEG